MLLFFVGWFVVALGLAFFLGRVMALGKRPEGVSPSDWERVTERHVPHVVPFKRGE